MKTPQRVAIITGAGAGIGRAVAVELAREGYALVLFGRTRETLSQTAGLCGDAPVETVGGDVADPEQCRRLIARAVERFGRLDVLINNAGTAMVRGVAESSPDVLRTTFGVNTIGPAVLMHYAWPVFREQFERAGVGGCVVNVSSVAALDPFPGFFAYGASKAALDSLTLSAAREGTAIGTRVFSVNPGAVETELLRSAFDTAAVPLEETMSPASIARVILDCIRGAHDAHAGRPLPVLPSVQRGWWMEWATGHRAPDAVFV
jgi:NAD(P)-dependent dehydrogenase (short-subunit alcohol dehydrogenase family)